MSTIVGTGSLVRLIVRRDRWAIPVWITLPAFVLALTAAAFQDLYPTAEARAEFAALMSVNPGFTAFLGPLSGSDTGALTFWRTVIIGVVFAGLVPLFGVIRHTRADEQAGRRELIGSTVVGRHSPLAAAMSVAASYSVLMGLAIAVGLVAVGLDAGGSFAAGAAWTGFALTGTGIGGLSAQLVENPRTARGIGVTAVAVMWVMRIIGDAAGGIAEAVWWASPVAWMHAVQPFDGDRWWVLGLFVIACLVLTSAAFVLSARRDIGAGVFATRLGPSAAPPRFGSVGALARRLHRGAFVGWSVGIAGYAAMVGGLGPSMGDIFDDNPQLKEIFERLGGEGVFIDVFITAGLGFVALIAAAYAVQATLRLRAEEEAGHAEAVLATPVTRERMFASHARLAVLGPVGALALGGLVAGTVYGIVIADPDQIPRLTGAALAHAPSVAVLSGLTLLLIGAVPTRAGAAFAILGGFMVLGQLGPIIGVDQWVMNLSPFTHTPAMPASGLRLEPLLWMTTATAALSLLGLAAFKRRDVGA